MLQAVPLESCFGLTLRLIQITPVTSPGLQVYRQGIDGVLQRTHRARSIQEYRSRLLGQCWLHPPHRQQRMTMVTQICVTAASLRKRGVIKHLTKSTSNGKSGWYLVSGKESNHE